jgi:hypothetical protein
MVLEYIIRYPRPTYATRLGEPVANDVRIPRSCAPDIRCPAMHAGNFLTYPPPWRFDLTAPRGILWQQHLSTGRRTSPARRTARTQGVVVTCRDGRTPGGSFAARALPGHLDACGQVPYPVSQRCAQLQGRRRADPGSAAPASPGQSSSPAG